MSPTTRMSVTLSAEQIAKVDSLAAHLGKSRARALRLIIDEALNSEEEFAKYSENGRVASPIRGNNK